MQFELYPHYWVNHLSFLVRKRLVERFAAIGYDATAEEWAVLMILNSNGPMTPTALSEVSFRDRTTVTRMIDKMVRKGLVERKSDPRDRRLQQLRLTDRGQDTFKDLAIEARALIARSLDGIPLDDLEATARTLAQMANNLTEEEPDEL